MIWDRGLGLVFEGSDNESNADNTRISASHCQILRGELTATDDATKAILKSLPPLESFSALRNDCSRIDTAGLVMVLHHSQGTLKEFHGPQLLRGSQDDFQNLLLSLSLLKALQIFEWTAHGYTPIFDVGEETDEAEDDNDDDDDADSEEMGMDMYFQRINIDDVLQAIAAAKAPLTDVSLKTHNCPSALVLECLNGNKSTLRTFEANIHDWDHATVQTMKAFLASDACRLEGITLGLRTIAKESFPIVKDLLGAVLKGSTSLRKFEVPTYCRLAENEGEKIYMEFYLLAAELLRTNTNLRSFVQSFGTVIPGGILPRVLKAFVNALKKNMTLERVELLVPYRQRSHPAIIDMNCYLEMNRLGRKNIIENGHFMARSGWVAEMAKDTSNVDWLLFLLKSNPMLCQSAPLNQPTAGGGSPTNTSPSVRSSITLSSASSSCSSKRGSKCNGKRKRA